MLSGLEVQQRAGGCKTIDGPGGLEGTGIEKSFEWLVGDSATGCWRKEFSPKLAKQGSTASGSFAGVAAPKKLPSVAVWWI
jgi:hypothetical protein